MTYIYSLGGHEHYNENIIPNYIFIFVQDAEKKAGHSTLLADKPDLYEILVDDVKPEKWEDYLKHKGNISGLKNWEIIDQIIWRFYQK